MALAVERFYVLLQLGTDPTLDFPAGFVCPLEMADMRLEEVVAGTPLEEPSKEGG